VEASFVDAIVKTAFLIDGGYVRACAKTAAKVYDNAFIESFALKCVAADEYIFRFFYYDAPQYRGKVQAPVSGTMTTFNASDQWLTDLAKVERFAVRRGTMGFRGWKPKAIPIPGSSMTDADFSPIFEQKGVDMRIGLDIATFCDTKAVERIVLVSGDTDMVPAMKHARKAGLEICVVEMPAPCRRLHDALLAHSDLVRAVSWP
jgi:uncharacterized LabA/DUF88 family protein